MTPRSLRLLWLAGLALTWGIAGDAPGQEAPEYQVDYTARIVPTERAAHVSVRLRDPEGLVRQLRFRIDSERHRDFEGGGSVEVDDDQVTWVPDAGTSTLRYVFRIDHLRNERSYDARCAESWAIFRGDDLVPPAAVRTGAGAVSVSRLRLNVPDGWSVVAPYDRASDGAFQIDDPQRRFDRPTGWLALGRLGVTRESVAGSRIAIAGPVGQHLRRLDILALLRWTLPELRKLVGELPDRLVVVGAGDPMWRGGLSGPRSAFIHSSRPLITGDGTSPVLHELVHAVLRLAPGNDGDWVVEGLSEYFALQALGESKTLSRKRITKAFNRLATRGRQAKSLEVAASHGAVTARGVTVLRSLDAEIRKLTLEERGLEDAVRVLMDKRDPVTIAGLRSAAEEVIGKDLGAFFRRYVSGPGGT